MKNINNILNDFATSKAAGSLNGLFNILPNPDKILRKTGKTIETYRDLKNDPHLWSCIQSRKSGMLPLEYQILPMGAENQIVELIQKIFYNLDIQKIERDILEAVLFGFQPLEVKWSLDESADRLVPVDLLPKPQEWFSYDRQGKLLFRKAGSIQAVEIPDFKIINVQYEATEMNPYGHSLLAKCYWPITFKNGGLKFWVVFAEKFGMPMVIGQYLRGATQDEIFQLAEKLATMTQDTAIVTPSDIKVELREAGRSSSVALFRDLIKYCNAEISKAILSQTLTTELDMGSYAASMVHYKIRREVVMSDIRLVESAFNTLIKFIVDLNFAGGKYPKFKIIFNDGDNAQKIERDAKLVQQCGLKFSKEYWTTNYGFKESDLEF